MKDYPYQKIRWTQAFFPREIVPLPGCVWSVCQRGYRPPDGKTSGVLSKKDSLIAQGVIKDGTLDFFQVRVSGENVCESHSAQAIQ